MKGKHVIILTAIFSLLVPAMASAQVERLLLKYNDRQIRSKKHNTSSLSLKSELKARYPGLDFSDYRLLKTVVMAKSRKGNGMIRLQVQNRTSSPYKVYGTPAGFNNSARFNYHKVELNNPANHSKGPWQLHFNGNFKVRKILVVVERKPEKQYGRWDRSDDWSRDHRHRPYIHPGNGSWAQRPGKPASHTLILPARNWGTEMEGEKKCGTRSGKVRDGWRYPNTICDPSSSATFRKGYRPIKIFVKPDIRSMDRRHQTKRIRAIEITLSLDNHGYNNSATIGIDIGGRNYSKYVRCNSRDNKQTTFTISGNWHPSELDSSRVWILPGHGRSDLTIKQMRIEVKQMS